jgi:Fe-S cluster assembly iron-binding protein IscA
MALDEPKDDDAVVENRGIKFVMDNQTTDILRQSGGLTIDYIDEASRRGYMLKLGATAGDCGTGGGGCSGCG